MGDNGGMVASLILTVVGLGLLILKVYALIDCVQRPAAAFLAHGKLSKPAWLAILGFALLLHLVGGGGIGLLGIIGTIAAIVYLVDVKPTVTGANDLL